MAIDQLSDDFVAAYADWLGVAIGEARQLLEEEPLEDVTGDRLQAAGWDESEHPRQPEGTETGGQFAEKGTADGGVRLEGDWSRNPARAREVQTVVDELAARYDTSFKRVRVRETEEFEQLAGKSNDTIYVSPRFLDDKFMDEHLRTWKTVSNTSTPADIVAHEFGHILDGELLRRRPDLYDRLNAFLDEKVELGDTGRMIPRVQSGLEAPSAYGSENRYEFVAEGFIDWYRNGEKAHPSSVFIGKLFDEGLLARKKPVTAAAWDESEHPRDPGGEGGGEFIEKGATGVDEAKPEAKRLDLKPAWDMQGEEPRKQTQKMVEKRVQQVMDDVADFYGADRKSKAFYEPEATGTWGVDARAVIPPSQMEAADPQQEVWYGLPIMDKARDPYSGVMPYRQIAHEAIHANVSGQRFTHGFYHDYEEAASEILSINYWNQRGQPFEHRDAVRVDGRWTDPGAESLAHSVVYRDQVADLMRRAASKVGWDRDAVTDEVLRVVRGDSNTKLKFRDSTNPEFAPPKGVSDDAVGMIRWLIDKDSVTAAGFDPAKHPRHPAGSESGGEFAPKDTFVGQQGFERGPGRVTIEGERPRQSVSEIFTQPPAASLEAAVSDWAHLRELRPDMETVNVDELVPTQDVVSAVRVEEYLQGLREDGNLPELLDSVRVVEGDGGRLYIADGHNRVAAAMRAGHKQLYLPVIRPEKPTIQYQTEMTPIAKPYRLPKTRGKNAKWKFYGELRDESGQRHIGGVFRDEKGEIRVLDVEYSMVKGEIPRKFTGKDFEKAGVERISAAQEVQLYRLKPGIQAAGFDESKHPRHPAGSEKGGEFAPKLTMPEPSLTGPSYIRGRVGDPVPIGRPLTDGERQAIKEGIGRGVFEDVVAEEGLAVGVLGSARDPNWEGPQVQPEDAVYNFDRYSMVENSDTVWNALPNRAMQYDIDENYFRETIDRDYQERDEPLEIGSPEWEEQATAYRSDLEETMRHVADEGELMITTPDGTVFNDILVDGRFKSQFETGSSGGAFLPDVRAAQEKMFFGYPQDMPIEERPVYGWMQHPDHPDQKRGITSQYGTVTWHIKPEVKARTTMSFVDSLSRPIIPGPVKNPGWRSTVPPGYEDNGLMTMVPDHLHDEGLFVGDAIETQYHGGLTLDDVSGVDITVFSGWDVGEVRAINQTQIEELEARGIPVHFVDEYGEELDDDERVPLRR